MALRWDARQIIGCVHCKTTVTWRNYSRHSQIIHNVIFSKDDVQWIDLNTNITKKGTLSLGERKSYVHEYEESQIATHQQSDKPEPHETTHDSTFPTEIPAPICPSSQQCTAISVRDKEGAPSPTASALDLLTCLPSLQYVFDAFKDQESSTIHDNQEMYQEELAIMSHDLCELYTKLAEKCDASPNTTKYKEFLATAQQNGINEHCYKKNSMQGKTAINLKKSVHQMSQYIVNIDEELSKDYYEMIFAFDLMCSVVCKKCDGQRKDSKVIDSWIKRIQYFIKIYYQFVGKYRNTGKGGRANFGFKIHLLWHVCDWIEYFGISPAHIDEQRIEHLHVVINRAIKMFGAVQGRDKLKHIMRYVSLHSLYA
eukprot:171526_1